MSPTPVLRSAGILTVLLFLAMAIHAAPLEPSIPAIQLTFSKASFDAIIAQWQPEGVRRFRWHFAIDFPFLVSYAWFGYLLSRHSRCGSGRSACARELLAWALPVAAIMDGVENVLHLSFVDAAVSLPGAMYFAAGVVATAKWALIVAFAIGIGYSRWGAERGRG